MATLHLVGARVYVWYHKTQVGWFWSAAEARKFIAREYGDIPVTTSFYPPDDHEPEVWKSSPTWNLPRL